MKTYLSHSSPIGKILGRLLSLLIVFLLIAATAVWTGKLFGREIGATKPAAATSSESVAPPNAEQMRALQLDNSSVRLAVRDSASWTVSDAESGAARGIIISSLPYARNVQGFAGTVPVYIYIGESGHISSSTPTDNAETADFLARAANGTLKHWQGLTPEAGADLKVDAVSGATFSSKALVANMQAALKGYNAGTVSQASEPVIGWPRTLAVAAVFLFGIAVAWRFRGNRLLRIAVLLLNVGVTGFWCGQFLSLSLLRGWIANGFDPIAYLPAVLMLAVALLLPFFGRPRHHCTWVCPYGSLQELAWRIPLPKIRCSAKAFRIMSHVRLGLLSVLLLLLWTGTGAFLLDYEPFSAFLLSAAPPAVTVLAGAFVVASCFVPNLWCKACCPVGALLDMAEK